MKKERVNALIFSTSTVAISHRLSKRKAEDLPMWVGDVLEYQDCSVFDFGELDLEKMSGIELHTKQETCCARTEICIPCTSRLGRIGKIRKNRMGQVQYTEPGKCCGSHTQPTLALGGTQNYVPRAFSE